MRRTMTTALAGLALAFTIGLGAPAASAAPAAIQVQAPAEAPAAAARVAHVSRGALARMLIRATAELTGAELSAVRQALRDGQSLAEFAAANGSSGEAVVQAVVARARERLDKAVENGRITQEQAEELIQRLTERATELVNRKRGA